MEVKNLLTLILALVWLTACHKDETGPPTPPQPVKRTVIVYMAADNSLSSRNFPQDDIDEMIEGGKELKGNQNLVVFVDRILGTEKPFIAKITNSKTQPVDTLYTYAEDFYSSDPERMSEVLTRIADLCPAEEYGLVLWGHADGWLVAGNTISPRRAYGVDNGNSGYSNSGPWMNIPTLRTTLANTGMHWKFVFCDCCNMMCAEVAYELSDVADYLLGAPSEIPGEGAPYNTMLPHFFLDTENFYDVILADYAKAKTGYLPLSAVRLDKMPELAEATKDVLPLVAAWLQQPEAMEGVIYYHAPYGRFDDSHKIMYDMQHVMQQALAAYPQAYENWSTAYTDAVVSTVKSLRWETNRDNTVNFADFSGATTDNQGCVSMFFPMDKYKQTTQNYNYAIRQMQWYQAVGWSEAGW